jgi:hypothetical protein
MNEKEIDMHAKFSGAAAVGSLVVFAPLDADVVGVYNIYTQSFDSSVSTGDLTENTKFAGAAAVGNLVVFSPRKARKEETNESRKGGRRGSADAHEIELKKAFVMEGVGGWISKEVRNQKGRGRRPRACFGCKTL